MIARHWRGWTDIRNADAFEHLVQDIVLPSLKEIAGYRGGYILRADGPQEAEFVVVNLFDTLEAVKQFAGPDYAVPVVIPEAHKLLSRSEPTVLHYEVRAYTL